VVLVLNKIDLVPKEIVAEWLKYLRNFHPTVAFKASTQEQRHKLGHAKAGASAAGTSECVGADTLMQLLKNYTRNQGMQKSITVGVVGYPNVGKSSLINSLKRSRVRTSAPHRASRALCKPCISTNTWTCWIALGLCLPRMRRTRRWCCATA